jgi:hypothetical protein
VVHVDDNVPDAVYIGRAMPQRQLSGSIFANPFQVGWDGDRDEAIARYRMEMAFLCRESPDHLDALRELVGKPLACWCRHDGEDRADHTACHGDVLIGIMRELGFEDVAEEQVAREVPRLRLIHGGRDRVAAQATHVGAG